MDLGYLPSPIIAIVFCNGNFVPHIMGGRGQSTDAKIPAADLADSRKETLSYPF
jgi:hypothetical protein